MSQNELDSFCNIHWYHQALDEYHKQALEQNPDLDPHDIINIQFTSGTTSSPKAACLTHINILNNAYFVGKNLSLTANDTICCAPPLFHCFGIVLGVLAAMTHGCNILLPSESFNPKDVLDAVIENDATVLYGVPTMFLAELEEISLRPPSQRKFPKLRTGLIGGSVVAPALRQRLQTDLNLSSLLNIYGMTESSPVCCMTRLDDKRETHFHSVGSVMPHTEIKIVSPENTQQTMMKEVRGELLISGYLVMKEYWEDERKTAEAFVIESPNPSNVSEKSRVWLRTGDEAVMRLDGTIQITGRIKDTIIRAGENIYPSEVENILLRHELISSVAVVGLPDAYYGEVVAAFVVPHPHVEYLGSLGPSAFDLRQKPRKHIGQDLLTFMTPEIIRSCVRASLSKNCVPKYVFWMSEFPLTASGKIEKYKLKSIGERVLTQNENQLNYIAASLGAANDKSHKEVKLPSLTTVTTMEIV
ncbi:S-dihydroxybenzoyltransferase [Arthrobotrys entomopaga]|nr:S-dihydroxybenzoyltransferase [Arthrobotrys entomopaga]